MSKPEDENPHGFNRDVQWENAALHVPGMTPEKVKTTLLSDIKVIVKTEMEKQRRMKAPQDTSPKVVRTAVLNHYDSTKNAVVTKKRSRPKEFDRDIMTASELQLVDSTTASPSAGIHQAIVHVPDDDPCMRGIENLVGPLDVVSMTARDHGITLVNERISAVLRQSHLLEESINTKRSMILTNADILDDDIEKEIRMSIESDLKQISVLVNWIRRVLEDLTSVIQRRIELQKSLSGMNNTRSAIQKIASKVLSLKTLYSAVQAQCDCIQIPSSPQQKETIEAP